MRPALQAAIDQALHYASTESRARYVVTHTGHGEDYFIHCSEEQWVMAAKRDDRWQLIGIALPGDAVFHLADTASDDAKP